MNIASRHQVVSRSKITEKLRRAHPSKKPAPSQAKRVQAASAPLAVRPLAQHARQGAWHTRDRHGGKVQALKQCLPLAPRHPDALGVRAQLRRGQARQGRDTWVEVCIPQQQVQHRLRLHQCVCSRAVSTCPHRLSPSSTAAAPHLVVHPARVLLGVSLRVGHKQVVDALWAALQQARQRAGVGEPAGVSTRGGCARPVGAGRGRRYRSGTDALAAAKQWQGTPPHGCGGGCGAPGHASHATAKCCAQPFGSCRSLTWCG